MRWAWRASERRGSDRPRAAGDGVAGDGVSAGHETEVGEGSEPREARPGRRASDRGGANGTHEPRGLVILCESPGKSYEPHNRKVAQ